MSDRFILVVARFQWWPVSSVVSNLLAPVLIANAENVCSEWKSTKNSPNRRENSKQRNYTKKRREIFNATTPQTAATTYISVCLQPHPGNFLDPNPVVQLHLHEPLYWMKQSDFLPCHQVATLKHLPVKICPADRSTRTSAEHTQVILHYSDTMPVLKIGFKHPALSSYLQSLAKIFP